MDLISKFLNKIAHKFPKGYPDMNNEQDILIIESELKKLDLYLEEDLDSTIKDLTGKQKGPSKLQTFSDLATLTYSQYRTNLGKIAELFPNTVNTIKDWRKYVDKDLSNRGVMIENCIKNYSIKNNVEAKGITKGKGEDLLIDGKVVEVKSMKDNKINTQLQTSFYTNDPNKFYFFVSNTSSPDIDIRVVSSQLLYKAALGDEIVDEIESKKRQGSDILSQQLDDGLKTLNIKNFIMSSLLTGKTSSETKSFFIGKDKNIRIRFVIYIEPK
jgi:hypothetical protein